MPSRTRDKNTTLRRYGMSDIPYIADVAAREVPKLPNYAGVVVDRSRVTALLEQNVNNDGYFVTFLLVNDVGEIVGGIGGYCVTMAFSWDRVTNDVFFFILPEWRTLPNALKLMRAYLNWALARKATIIGATYTGGGNDEGMDRLIRSIGFEPIGKLYHYRQRSK